MQASSDGSRGALARRDVVEHALQRRSRLNEIRAGLASAADACDAHPHLLLAARHYGTPTGHACPVCAEQTSAKEVHFVYGDSLGDVAGQAKTPREIEQLAVSTADFHVYDVEVCTACKWNHLLRSYVTGRADLPQPRPKRNSPSSRINQRKDRFP